jgi:hypothetical protein
VGVCVSSNFPSLCLNSAVVMKFCQIHSFCMSQLMYQCVFTIESDNAVISDAGRDSVKPSEVSLWVFFLGK